MIDPTATERPAGAGEPASGEASAPASSSEGGVKESGSGADARCGNQGEGAPMSQGVFEAEATFKSWDDDYYPPLAERLYDRAIGETLRLLQSEEGDTVLDAGCGPGVHSIRAARAGVRCRAIDISQWVLDEAKRRASEAGVLDRIDFQQADLTNLPFDDASFDRIFSWGVVIHIPNIEDALRELVRILKPGGRLALYLTNRSAWEHTGERLARWALRRPHPGSIESLPLGEGCWYEMHDERLWVWRIDHDALEGWMAGRGLRRVARRAGEFNEVQRRVKGPLRQALLRMNNLYWSLRLPAGPAAANLVVFEKPAR